MRTFATQVEAAIKAEEVAIAGLALFAFPEGNFGLWTGTGTIPWNGFVYRGVDRYLEFPGISRSTGNEAQRATLNLSGVPSDLLDPDWQAALEGYAYDNAPVTLTWLALDPKSRAVIGQVRTERFEMDSPAYQVGEPDENGVCAVTISVPLETPARNISGQSYARRTLAEQQADNDPDDTGFQFVSVAGKFTIQFGKIKG